jgi:hypothetical protein
LRFALRYIGGISSQIEVRDEALDEIDRHGFIHPAACTDRFAGVMTDPTTDRWQRVFLFDELEGLVEFPFGRQGDVALDTDVGRALNPAGGRTPFGDREGARNGLGVFLVSGLALSQALVVFVRKRDRADLDTVAAGRALGFIDETRLFAKGDLEFARRPFDMPYFGAGNQVDIKMPADLDQFGREDSHGAIVGGEGLVQLTHHPADGGGFFHQVYEIARLGQIQGGLHARNTATGNQNGA